MLEEKRNKKNKKKKWSKETAIFVDVKKVIKREYYSWCKALCMQDK